VKPAPHVLGAHGQHEAGRDSRAQQRAPGARGEQAGRQRHGEGAGHQVRLAHLAVSEQLAGRTLPGVEQPVQ
jgi:hypothetical protein